MDEHVIPAISPEMAARHAIQNPADLVRQVLLQVAARPVVWQRWFEALALPVRKMRWGAQFELTTHLIQAVASGLGVGLLLTFLVEDELRQGALDAALDEEFCTSAGYFFLASPGKLALPAVAAFRDWLLDQSAAVKSAR